MVAKSIAKIYTNIHKPTDYYWTLLQSICLCFFDERND